MEIPYAWVDLVMRNVNNTALDTMSTLTPTDVNLPDARQSIDAKNTLNEATQNQIKPFWDSRWSKDFKLDNLKQVMPGSPKHRIWIGNISPNFNPKREQDVVQLEYGLRAKWLEYLEKEPYSYSRKEQLYNTANTLFSVFGKMIFLTILDGGDDEQSA
tara:strand:+ start:6551 stop:7024 length:474 start_codon:yes stop_codon:yes gene_type:complete